MAEEDVQAMEEELERIRSDIVATRAAARLLKHEVRRLEWLGWARSCPPTCRPFRCARYCPGDAAE